MLVLKGFVGLHRTVQIQLLPITVWGTDLDFCDTDCLSWKRTEIILSSFRYKYSILESFVDYGLLHLI